jgi:predicted SAM-dependent methyltransferase
VKLSIQKLYECSKDRPLVTPELHPSNDFYGHATILKKYAQIQREYQIKAVIEHGPFLPDWVWDVDIKFPLPAMLVYGAYRYPILREKTNKALFSIGPIIRYASHFLDKHTLGMEKQRIGKTLLVFPDHSTHWVETRYDIHEYCRMLEDIGKEFNTVMVCIYWEDVLRGIAEKYMEHGFECVTAGHMYDPLFLSRLKSIIELATISTSCSIGTQVCCCIAMGKPHFITKIEVKHTAESPEILERDMPPKSVGESAVMKIQMRDAFSEIRSDISQKQIEFANKYWGFPEFKTSEEMKLIFQITEDIWKKGRSFFVPSRDVLIEQAVDCGNSDDKEKALFLLEQAIAVNPDMPGLQYSKAVVLGRLGRINEAEKCVTDLLIVVPDHEKGLLLFEELRRENRKKSNLDDKSTLNRIGLKTNLHSKMLNLGCGGRYHPDWVNVDLHSTGDGVIAHNLNEGIPFENNSFDVVYHSHLLEHLPLNQVHPFLKECFRVLNVGGIIRVAVPDLEQIVKCYLTLLEKSIRGDEAAQKQYEWILLELFDQMVRNVSGGEMLKYLKQDPVPAASFALERMGSEVSKIMGSNQNSKIKHIKRSEAKMVLKPEGIGRFRLSGEIHQWMYDRYSLGKLLLQVGFKDIIVCPATESQIPKFNSYLLDIENDSSIRKPDSLFMEATK